MYYSDICAAVERIKKKYKESDPFRLCEKMGIVIIHASFSTAPNAIKGFFLEANRIRTITVNTDLPLVIQKIIVAHELGHAVLHRTRGLHAFHDVSLYDESSVMEQEANLFAAEYYLEDEDVLAHLNSDSTFFSAAAALFVPIELLDFKFRVMKWKGYKLIEPPIAANNNFLGSLEVPVNADYEC